MIESQPAVEQPEAAPSELDAFVISLVGDFDIAERARLLDAFAVATCSAVVVIDFRRTRYVDSTVLECLVALQRALGKRGGRLLLVELSPEIRRIFDICGLDRLLHIRGSLSEVMHQVDAETMRVRRLTLIAEPTEAVELDGRKLK